MTKKKITPPEQVQVFVLQWSELKKYLIEIDPWAKKNQMILDLLLAEYLMYSGQQFRMGNVVRVGYVDWDDFGHVPSSSYNPVGGIIHLTSLIRANSPNLNQQIVLE